MPPKSSKPKPIARRQSIRRKVHPTKSPYFEHPSEDDIVDDAGKHSDDYAQSDSGSDFREDNAATVSDTVVEEARVNEDANKSKKRGRASSVAKPSKKSSAAKKKKNDNGVIFIPYRMPSPGGIDYADDQIHPNTLKFLEDLAENNNRNWLREHDSFYRAGKADFEKFVEYINATIPERVDDTIPELPIKDLTYFSAAWSRTGRKGPYACYYLQIQPGQSLAGGGLWSPHSNSLLAIRRAIDKHPERIRSVITDKEFVAEFFDSSEGSKGSTNKDERDEESIISLFFDENAADAVKTAPRFFPKTHPNISLLRLRSFTISKSFTDEEVLSSDFGEKVLGAFGKMKPLITYLNDTVMPDING
ncbi:hypothetical protein BZA77DRAFT_312341 [Pyronema omphalodes]|nr:hypothetical protein BZA77DRAFT_312341 [Pyronema omphalodes]